MVFFAVCIGGFLMLFFFLNAVNSNHRRKPRVVEGFSGQPLAESDAGKLGAMIMKRRCPDCGGRKFYEGPSGGMSTNVFCGTCGQGYNFTNIFGEGHAERIRKDERYIDLGGKPA